MYHHVKELIIHYSFLRQVAKNKLKARTTECAKGTGQNSRLAKKHNKQRRRLISNRLRQRPRRQEVYTFGDRTIKAAMILLSKLISNRRLMYQTINVAVLSEVTIRSRVPYAES